MTSLLGLDVGTSSTKCLIVDDAGKVIASADAPHEIHRPRDGWSEQEPENWWQAGTIAIRAALNESGLTGRNIHAVGMSGQMHGSVFLPKAPDPTKVAAIRPALLWNDQRTAKQCRAIEDAAGGTEALVGMTGNAALTGLTAPKILWLREHEPAHFAKLTTVVNPKDYVRFRLTGDLAIDVGDASGFGVFDPRQRAWCAPLLRGLDLDESILPRVVESQDVVGQVTRWAAEQTGLVEGTPVVTGSGDQMTGAIGTGTVAPGLVSATLGTSGVVFAHLGDTLGGSLPATLQTMCSAVKGEWCTYGCTLSAAGALHWYRDAFAKSESFRALDDEAARIAPGADGLLFLPYLTGERSPVSDPLARGAFIGLTARHTRGHLTRAVLEGVAFTMRAMLDLVRSMGVSPREVRMAGGGAKSDLWCRIIASAFGCPTHRLETVEGSAYGAALLAGVGIGHWPSIPDACQACIHVRDRIEPQVDAQSRYDALRPVYDDLYQRLQPTMHALADSGNTRPDQTIGKA